jgi:DNA-directed RNA polymerase subunit M/transcription elongation factor TFIIS
MTKITTEMEQKYIKSGGQECPICGYHHFESDIQSDENGTMKILVKCFNCNNTWIDVYQLIEVEENNNG